MSQECLKSFSPKRKDAHKKKHTNHHLSVVDPLQDEMSSVHKDLQNWGANGGVTSASKANESVTNRGANTSNNRNRRLSKFNLL